MPKCSIIAYSNQKGGVAKTTSCANMAYGIARRGWRVLCIDLDPQGNLSMAMGLQQADLEDRVTAKEVLEESGLPPAAFYQVSPTLSLVPAALDLANAEQGIIGSIDRNHRLINAIKKGRAREMFDFILVDSPPNLSTLTINALTAATHVIIPVQCEGFSLSGLASLLNTIVMVRENTNAALQILGLLPTLYDNRKKLNREVIKVLPTILDGQFKDIVMVAIPDNIALSEASNHGMSIFDYRRDSPGARAYEEAVTWILGRLHGFPSSIPEAAGVV